MSTSGVIARKTANGFTGVYHYWDSYPSGLGETLYALYHEQFHEDVEAMLKMLIDEHPAGWWTIKDCDFSLEPGHSGTIEYHQERIRPQCRCYGEWGKSAQSFTERNTYVDFAYVFNGTTMDILTPDGGTWRSIGLVSLDSPAPDWTRLK